MSLLKIGGKSDSNTVLGFSLTDEGYTKATRFWGVTIQEIFNGTISDTSAKNTLDNVFNCEEYGFISLRCYNTTDVKIECILYSDIGSSTLSNYLEDNDGNNITFTIPTGQSILTPEDLPVLNYLRFLKFRLQPIEAPSTPAPLSIKVYAKR